MRRNYHTKLSACKLSGEIITGNYDQVYYVAQKCVNYRDTAVSKNIGVRLFMQTGLKDLNFHHDFGYSFPLFS